MIMILERAELLVIASYVFQLISGIEIQDTEPRNMATTRGSGTLFRCSRSNLSDTFRILWRYYSTDDPKTRVDIYNGHTFLNRTRGSFRLNETESGQYDLIINSTILEDAGTYQCARRLDEEYPAELIVLASDPECQLTHNITNDTVVVSGELHMWCTVEFRGNWRPSMEWRTDRGVALTSSTTTIHKTNQSTRVVTSTLQLRARLNGTRIQCVTKFVEGSSHELVIRNGTMTPATNAPDYSHVWTSPAIYFSPNQATYLIILSISAIIISIVLLQCCIVLIVRKKRKRPANIQERGRTNAPVINIKMDMTMEKKHSGGRSDERESYDDEIKRDTLAEKYDSMIGNSQANPYATNKLFG